MAEIKHGVNCSCGYKVACEATDEFVRQMATYEDLDIHRLIARIESDRAEIARLKAEVERLKDAAAVVSNTLNDIRGGFHAGVDPSRWVDEVRAYLGTGRAR